MTVLRSGRATDVGRVRTSNQDQVFAGDNLFAVADGMGGHVGGEVASQLAIETLERELARQPTVDGLRQAVVAANAAIWDRGRHEEDLRGMGTTLTAVALTAGVDGRDVIGLVNVGDSRAYLLSEGTVRQITVDHSLAEERVRHGEMTEEQAAVHPHRHILTRALGVSPEVEVDLWELHVRTGDRLLLCSDGLSNEVGLVDIANILNSVRDPRRAARALVKRANDHGGNDNVTVLVVDVLVGEQLSGGSVVEALVGKPFAVPPEVDSGPTIGSAASGPPSLKPIAAPGRTGGTESAFRRSDPTIGASVDSPPKSDGSGSKGESGAQAPPRPNDQGPSAQTPSVSSAQTGVVLKPRIEDPAPVKVPSPEPVVVARTVGADVFVGSPPAPASALPSVRERPITPESERPSTETRRQRLGVPRRITLRVIIFFILVAAVVVAAYIFVRWYATDNWYVTVDRGYVVIYRGRPGGLLGFHPKVVERTTLPATSIPADQLSSLRSDVNEPTLKAAKKYVANLQNEAFTYAVPQQSAMYFFVNGPGTITL